MGTRIKTFVATGVAPDGRLYAGDLNAMEDQYADLMNLSQVLGVGSMQIGESGLQLVRYGAGEARITGMLRTDGILRGLGGLYAGAFTTTQRDTIDAGSRPYGLVILNTTNNRLEVNVGTDAAPSWTSLGAAITSGTLASRPAASSANANSWYFATDDTGGTLYFSTGSTWTKASKGLTQAPQAHQSTHIPGGSDALPWTTIHGSGTLAARPAAASTNAGYTYFATDDTGGTLYRSTGAAWVKIAVPLSDPTLSDTRTPTDNTVSTAKIQNGAVSFAKIGTDVPVVPLGATLGWPWAGGSIPAWSVLPYGQLLTQTSYPGMQTLADAAGRPYGGSAGVNFNTPDMRGRVEVGKDDMGGTAANRITVAVSGVSGATLGAVFGAEGVTLTTAQLPAHNHGVTGAPGISDPGHRHLLLSYVAGGTNSGGTTINNNNQSNGYFDGSPPSLQNSTTGISVSAGSLGTANAGSGSAHQNTQPSIVVNKIMRVL